MFHHRDFFRSLRGAPRVQPGTPERRRSVRHATVFQIAKLTVGDREELCILRDVSPNGLRAEVYFPLAVGEDVTVELRTGHSVTGRVAWSREQAIGVEFRRPIPMQAMLAHCSFDERVGKIRPPRIVDDLPGVLRIDQVDHPIRVKNISQAGMRILIDRPLRVEMQCAVEVEAFGRRPVSVRWFRDGEGGLLLSQPMTFAEFALWRRALARAREMAAA